MTCVGNDSPEQGEPDKRWALVGLAGSLGVFELPVEIRDTVQKQADQREAARERERVEKKRRAADEDARKGAPPQSELRRRHGPHASTILSSTFSTCATCVRTRCNTSARRSPPRSCFTQWLTPRADQYIVVGIGLDCFGSAHRSLGTLARLAGRLDDAVTHLAHALTANQHLGSARWVTRTQHDLARALLQRSRSGDTDRAADLAAAARPVAEQHGLHHTLSLLHGLNLDEM